MDDQDDEASALGTLQHWQQVYEQELTALREYGDVGEIWWAAEHLVQHS